MILAALNDYYQRLLDDPDSGVALPGYSQETIGFAIVLNQNGGVVDVQDLREKSGKKMVGKRLSVPASFKRPGIGSKPFFLWDKTSYSLGVGKDEARTQQNHEAFMGLHRAALAGSDDPALKALLVFLEAWKPEQFGKDEHFVRQGKEMLDANVVFRLDGEKRYLHERPAARELWEGMKGDDKSTDGFCLVTGERSKIARIHPSIKGIRGTDKAETSIVSFNKKSFESYGKDQGDNAPVSSSAAEAYTTALNHLLRGKRQRIDIGDANVVFWAQAASKEAAEEGEDLLAAFFDPKDEDVQATQRLHDALQLVRQGRPLRDLGAHLEDDTRIFVLGLAPNASRLSIRFWETATLARFAGRLADHFDDLALKPTPWRRAPTPQVLALATAPIYDGKAKADDIPPLLAGELARAVLTGARYPQSILSTVVMRFRADGQITGLRVALCKGVLARAARLGRKQGNPSKQGEPPMSLDSSCTDPGYLLGRLFSSLENIQRAALGKQINATIRDRYYGAASATPASIFPVLLRNVQNHLSKLRKEKAGLAVTLEKEIGQIVDALGTTFPRSLRIEQQGQFAIGYYHQTQARFAGNEVNEETESEGETA